MLGMMEASTTLSPVHPVHQEPVVHHGGRVRRRPHAGRADQVVGGGAVAEGEVQQLVVALHGRAGQGLGFQEGPEFGRGEHPPQQAHAAQVDAAVVRV
jgi:hypothetical protein